MFKSVITKIVMIAVMALVSNVFGSLVPVNVDFSSDTVGSAPAKVWTPTAGQPITKVGDLTVTSPHTILVANDYTDSVTGNKMLGKSVVIDHSAQTAGAVNLYPIHYNVADKLTSGIATISFDFMSDTVSSGNAFFVTLRDQANSSTGQSQFMLGANWVQAVTPGFATTTFSKGVVNHIDLILNVGTDTVEGKFNGVSMGTMAYTATDFGTLLVSAATNKNKFAFDNFQVVPEPATLFILGAGSLLLRRRSK